jgi:hypothetical protein
MERPGLFVLDGVSRELLRPWDLQLRHLRM